MKTKLTFKQLRDDHLIKQWPHMVIQLEQRPFNFNPSRIVSACVMDAFARSLRGPHIDALRGYVQLDLGEDNR